MSQPELCVTNWTTLKKQIPRHVHPSETMLFLRKFFKQKYYSAVKREGPPVICSNMGRPSGCCAKWNYLDRERQIPHLVSLIHILWCCFSIIPQKCWKTRNANHVPSTLKDLVLARLLWVSCVLNPEPQRSRGSTADGWTVSEMQNQPGHMEYLGDASWLTTPMAGETRRTEKAPYTKAWVLGVDTETCTEGLLWSLGGWTQTWKATAPAEPSQQTWPSGQNHVRWRICFQAALPPSCPRD